MNKDKKRSLFNYLIMGITMLVIIICMVFGSLFVANPKNSHKSTEYAKGYQVLIHLQDKQTGNGISKADATSIESNLDARLQGTGLTNPYIDLEGSGTDWNIRVSVSGVQDAEDEGNILNTILHQPTLSLYDINDKPLFTDSGYNKDASPFADKDQYQVFKDGTARFGILNQGTNPTNVIKVDVANSSAKGALVDASKDLSNPQGKRGNQMFFWFDHDDLTAAINKYAKGFQLSDWNLDNKNLNQFAFYNNPQTGVQTDKWREFTWYGDNKVEDDGSILWYNTSGKHTVKFSDYLFASPRITSVFSGNTFSIQGDSNNPFTVTSINALSSRMNFALSGFQLVEKSAGFVNPTYGKSAFDKLLIAGLIAFSAIAIFLIINYGLLGSLSVISLALYTFLTIFLFTVMRGEYSPETVAALVLGVGVALDAHIITFERIKQELRKGSSIKKANSKANSMSLRGIVDVNVTLLIVGLMLFFFASHSLKELSIILIISIACTLLISVLFMRVITWFIIRSQMFNNKPWLTDLKWKFRKSQNVPKENVVNTENESAPNASHTINEDGTKSINFIKKSKWGLIGSATIALLAIIVFGITAGIGGSIGHGVNRSISFSGGTRVTLYSKSDKPITSQEQIDAENWLTSQGLDSVKDIYNSNHQVIGLEGSTQDKINLSQQAVTTYANNHSWINSNSLNKVDPVVAHKLLRAAIYSILIAFAAMVLYILFRFNWTFSLSMLISMVHDGLIITAVFILTRLEFNPLTMATIITALGFSLNNKLIIFDEMRSLKKAKGRRTLSKADLTAISNNALKNMLSRTIIFSAISALIVLMFIVLYGSTSITFDLALMIGIIIGFASSFYFSNYLWVLLETKRESWMSKRSKKGFWDTKELEEQTIVGINDFKS